MNKLNSSVCVLIACCLLGQTCLAQNAITDWAGIVQPAINNASSPRPPASSEVLHVTIQLAVYLAAIAIEGGLQDFFVGTWTLEGETKASPFGPGGQKFKSTESLEWMPGGFFLLAHSYADGKLAELTIIGYDSNEKTLSHTSYSAAGQVERWRGTAEGDVWIWTKDETTRGKAIKVRLTIKKTSSRSYSFVEDVKAADGGAWSTVAEGIGTKTE